MLYLFFYVLYYALHSRIYHISLTISWLAHCCHLSCKRIGFCFVFAGHEQKTIFYVLYYALHSRIYHISLTISWLAHCCHLSCKRIGFCFVFAGHEQKTILQKWQKEYAMQYCMQYWVDLMTILRQ